MNAFYTEHLRATAFEILLQENKQMKMMKKVTFLKK